MATARTVGMKDVAREAGVSVGTVSNVLNRPDIVSPDRRERVEAVIVQLGYVRNDAARQLKLGRSSTVGAIVLDSANPFYAQLVGGIEAAAEDSQLMVITGSTGNREQRERLYLSLFEEQRVRGILLASTGGSAGVVEAIRGRGTPVVLLEGEPGTGGSSVSVDDIAGGEIAVQHLAGLGRRRIEVVAARQDLRQVADRLRGARRAAAAAGIEIEVLEAEDLTVLAGRTVGEEVVARSVAERPDAVFCVNDLLAVGVLQAFAFRHQVAVPEEIALVGYDDIAFARSTVVPLTSVSQPADLMGRTALALLEEEIATPEASPRHVSFTPTLVERESTTG
ncbi:LacI family DNA-binding transcriptional regulator [uncultured Brachybacterium sp.]|uniref:LacI family DNA-binding transcriptional regulator n=1 Tax=uncultured Brachybacterium sp. TaxID=189680 RepID=UPI00262144CB|nr:LacI family DNA-binding transcriptional regulator [uncultured Brachybacterium sp.]